MGSIALASILAGHFLAGYLHVSVKSIAVAAIAAPFLLTVQPLLGLLQGEQRFLPWSLLSILVNLSRLVFIAGLILPLGAFGFLLGNTIAAIVTFLLYLIPVWRPLVSGRGKFNWGGSLPFIVTGLVSTVTIGVFQGADVVMVERSLRRCPPASTTAVASVGSAVLLRERRRGKCRLPDDRRETGHRSEHVGGDEQHLSRCMQSQGSSVRSPSRSPGTTYFWASPVPRTFRATTTSRCTGSACRCSRGWCSS